MTTPSRKPFQFGLGSLFGSMVVVGAILTFPQLLSLWPLWPLALLVYSVGRLDNSE